MADHWLEISSTELDSFCGEEDPIGPLADALDGIDWWLHFGDEIHWFVIDLGQTYTITRVKGRSNDVLDPIDVNIYIDDNNPPTTLCEEGITTWKDTDEWVEIILTTPGTGRYIKVEIEDTEDIDRIIGFGEEAVPFTIFDAYGDVVAPPPPVGPGAGMGMSMGLGFGGPSTATLKAKVPHLDPGLGMKRHPRSRVH